MKVKLRVICPAHSYVWFGYLVQVYHRGLSIQLQSCDWPFSFWYNLVEVLLVSLLACLFRDSTVITLILLSYYFSSLTFFFFNSCAVFTFQAEGSFLDRFYKSTRSMDPMEVRSFYYICFLFSLPSSLPTHHQKKFNRAKGRYTLKVEEENIIILCPFFAQLVFTQEYFSVLHLIVLCCSLW